MKITLIEAFDIPDSWYKCLKACLEYGYEYTIERGSREGMKRKEFDYVTIKIEKPWIEPRVPDVPKDVPPPTDSRFVNEYMVYFMSGEVKEDLDYTYGERINDYPFKAMRFSQIKEVINMLKEIHETNQACIAVAMPTDILLKEPPCLREIDCRVRYGALHLIVYFRSWDLWGGYPTNMIVLQQLKEYIAKEIGVKDGKLIASSKGLHLYETEWKLARQVLGVKNV